MTGSCRRHRAQAGRALRLPVRKVSSLQGRCTYAQGRRNEA